MKEAKVYWSFLYDAMRKVCSPSVVMAAAEAALRTTAQLWGLKPTIVMEVVMTKRQ